MAFETWDIVYGAAGSQLSSARLVVDYNFRRLMQSGARELQCLELSDLVKQELPAVARIAMTVFPYTAKQQLRRDIEAAVQLLKEDGILLLCYDERRLKSMLRRLLTAAFAEVVPTEGGFLCRAPIRLQRETDPEPPTFQVSDSVSGQTLSFRTTVGLFCPSAIDAGTQVLLDALAERLGPDLSGRRILDIGCGYGAIGCTLAARGAAVTLVDNDWRAVKLARANLAENGQPGTAGLSDASSGLPAGPFDIAISNPPTHAGSDVINRLLSLAAEVASTVVVVVKEHLNYEKWLKDYSLIRLTDRDGYKVIAFRKARSALSCDGSLL